MNIDNLIAVSATLGGFGALVTVLVNLLKTAKVVKDGDSNLWVAAFNLLVLALALFFQVLAPAKLEIANAVAAQIAQYAQPLIAFVALIASSKVSYEVLKGLPFIGKTFSPKE
jgi:hypothetical protein